MKSYVKVKGIKKFLHTQKFDGIDLTKYTRVPRGSESIIGAATEAFGSSWFETPKGLALFKTYDNEDYIHIRELRIINELVCMNVIKDLGIPCAEYEPANFVFEEVDEDYSDGRMVTIRYDGLVTYNVAGIGEKLIPVSSLINNEDNTQFSLSEISEQLDNLEKAGYKFSKDDVMTMLFAGIVIDYITKQTDRNSTNISLLVDEQNNLRVAPIMDNEHAFYTLYMTKDMLYNIIFNDGKDEIDYADLKEMYTEHTSTSGFSIQEPAQNKRPDITRDIVSFALKDQKMMKVLKHILNNFDIEQAINTVKAQGIEIPDEYQDFITHVACESINELQELLQSEDQSTPQ